MLSRSGLADVRDPGSGLRSHPAPPINRTSGIAIERIEDLGTTPRAYVNPLDDAGQARCPTNRDAHVRLFVRMGRYTPAY
jgi:hypothetical protein